MWGASAHSANEYASGSFGIGDIVQRIVTQWQYDLGEQVTCNADLSQIWTLWIIPCCLPIYVYYATE